MYPKHASVSTRAYMHAVMLPTNGHAGEHVVRVELSLTAHRNPTDTIICLGLRLCSQGQYITSRNLYDLEAIIYVNYYTDIIRKGCLGSSGVNAHDVHVYNSHFSLIGTRL
jgi:hypothetical protein